MEFSPPRTFISYARRDGRDFAEAFERRTADAGLTAWRDMKSVEGGGDIRQQVLQLFGRLGENEDERIVALVHAPRRSSDFWPKPRWPGLTPRNRTAAHKAKQPREQCRLRPRRRASSPPLR